MAASDSPWPSPTVRNTTFIVEELLSLDACENVSKTQLEDFVAGRQLTNRNFFATSIPMNSDAQNSFVRWLDVMEFTTEQAAALLGKSPRMVQYYEMGRVPPGGYSQVDDGDLGRICAPAMAGPVSSREPA